MTTLQTEPQAIPILTVSKGRKGGVHLDKKALKKIFDNEKLADKPISIISIAGAFRKGKSFMMNFFLKYLRKNGHENSEWKGEDYEDLDEGFSWRGGKEACTHGILIWNEVFLVKKGGREIAVLLMDTQGLFDNNTDHKTNTLIFALSTLISSVQIFNLSQQIQENDLSFLQFFIEYAKASHEVSGISRDSNPFQTLIFLIRDCQFGEDDGFGFEGGENYLDEVLEPSSESSKENREVREYLKSSFEDIKCCLLPHPGKKVSSTKAFRGCLKDMDEDFVKELDPLLDTLFNPKHLITKTINGHEVTAFPLLKYICGCGEQLSSGSLPTPMTLMETTAEAQNLEAGRFCSEKYIEIMDKAIGDSFIGEGELKGKHVEALGYVLQEFEKRTKLGSEEIREKHRECLQKTILMDFERSAIKNNARRIEAEKIVMEQIEKLTREFKEDMEESLKGHDYLEDADLSKIHDQKSKMATKKFWEIAEIQEKVKKGFESAFLESIQSIYIQIKDENDHKRKIAQEKDETEKFLMVATLDGIHDYRDAMRKYVETYTEDSELEAGHERSKRNVLSGMERNLVLSKYKISPEKRIEWTRECKSRLADEYEDIKEGNGKKMAILIKQMESQRSDLCLDYEDYFRKLVKNDYIEPGRLAELHERKMRECIRETDKFTQGRCNVAVFAENVRKLKSQLEDGFEIVSEKNDANKVVVGNDSSCIIL